MMVDSSIVIRSATFLSQQKIAGRAPLYFHFKPSQKLIQRLTIEAFHLS
jgi:hypothetical protein